MIYQIFIVFCFSKVHSLIADTRNKVNTFESLWGKNIWKFLLDLVLSSWNLDWFVNI